MLNVQGDVIGLMDSDAEIVANYQYDPWGAVLSCTGSEASTIGAMNPLRYRGYYYDTETGFYYLQSRYYDPALGRFINADTNSTTDTQGFLSYNMFAYCENDPVMYEDPEGECLHLAIGALIGVGFLFSCDLVNHLVTGKDFSSKATYLGAAVGGALAASGAPLVVAMAGNGAISGGVYIADCISGEEDFSFFALECNIGIGAASGLIGGKGANAKETVGLIRENVKGFRFQAKGYPKILMRIKNIGNYKNKIKPNLKDLKVSLKKMQRACIFGYVGNKAINGARKLIGRLRGKKR